jgi:site-specific DNA recombinase
MPPKNKKSWSYSTVKQVLDNPTYAGYIRWGKQQNWSTKRRKGTTDEYILVKGTHEPIITEELWGANKRTS